MQFSTDQTSALTKIDSWLADPTRQVFTLHGYAGTGKTSLAKHIAQRHDGPVTFAAYTGKACEVLRRKGNPAETIHSLIYQPQGERTKLVRELKGKVLALAGDMTARAERERRSLQAQIKELLAPAWLLKPQDKVVVDDDQLLILDEVSMVDETIGQDLRSFPWKILTLGDPGQLPPIRGQGYFDQRPDYVLTEIHRQTRESPILTLATLARERRSLPFGKHGDCEVIGKKGIRPEHVFGVEQCVVGSNKARRELNAEFRALKGYNEPFPMEGERLICLRNNSKTGLLNGQMVTVAWFNDDDPPELCFTGMSGVQRRVKVHRECFTEPDELKLMERGQREALDEFDYGYAITCHKAQGSQFDSVLVYADMFHWDREMFAKWLYTAITRAVERVIVAL